MRQGNAYSEAVSRFGGSTREPHGRRLPSDHLDLAQAEAAAQTQRLDHRLLGGKAGSKVSTRPGAGDRVLALGRSEHALGQARVAPQSPLQARNLEQVDADAGDRRHPGYSVMPTISFAVASPSLLPVPIAMYSMLFR